MTISHQNVWTKWIFMPYQTPKTRLTTSTTWDLGRVATGRVFGVQAICQITAWNTKFAVATSIGMKDELMSCFKTVVQRRRGWIRTGILDFNTTPATTFALGLDLDSEKIAGWLRIGLTINLWYPKWKNFMFTYQQRIAMMNVLSAYRTWWTGAFSEGPKACWAHIDLYVRCFLNIREGIGPSVSSLTSAWISLQPWSI